jgi:hypothetical protein
MLTKLVPYAALLLCLSFAGCKKDDPAPAFQHTGEKWAITSFTYSLSSIKGTSVVVDNGTATNAGYVYFDTASGSFDITIKSTRVQDYFSHSTSGTDITITTVNQSVSPGKVSQNVIAFSGDKIGTTGMELDGSITKQSTSETFALVGAMILVKQ